MERTLDSICPSDGDSGKDNMSYLYGRDPSILAYGDRPIPTNKQNLISLFEDEEDAYTDDTVSDAITLQTVKVYLRVKPFPGKLKLTNEEAEAYKIANSTTLVTKLPNIDHNSSTLKGPKSGDTICRNFTFTKTFGPETTQFELFEQVIQQRVVDFLAGQNSTVMTYGTTNSGKSYTLQGTTTSPGIIPRGLEFVFSHITTRSTPSYKPAHTSDVVSLTGIERAQELELKNKLLTFASIDKHQYINTYKQMQKLLHEESPIRPSQACDAQYSVWVSFAEIYNENIYDLLSNDCQKRRPSLKLGTDHRGQAFIKGLKTICVSSGSEAYQVLMAGQYNLKVAATALNARSSRSHCIFTIKLLKYYADNTPDRVEVSTFAFCDLAGSERLKKTLNVGERLKEAQNINTSLLVLGRCLKSIYEGQSTKHRQEHAGPFRESKLTRLFQRALSGREQIAMIVNVNPIPTLYLETQNVLNFSAIAKQIVVEPKKIKRRVSNSRFSQMCTQSIKSSTDWDETKSLPHIVEQTTEEDIEASIFIHQDEFDDLMGENKALKKELAALKASMFHRDLQIRQELADTYTSMMKKLEADWKNRIKDVEEQQEDQLEWSVNRVETFYKEKIRELTSRKRRRTDDDDDSDEETRDIDKCQIENSRLTVKIQSLKKIIKNLRETNESTITEKNRNAFELGLLNEEMKSVKSLLAAAQEDLCRDGEVRVFVEKLQSQLTAKQAHIQKLKEFLDEAKEEYIGITADAGAMERRLTEQEELLVKSEERVSDLEELLEQVNVCLAEQTQRSEALEEKLHQESNLLHDSEMREQSAQAKLKESEETIRDLREKLASLEMTIPRPENVTPDSLFDEVQIKKENLSESQSEVSFENSTNVLPGGIVVKTDDELLGFSSSKDDRDSEMLFKVQEIIVAEKSDENDSLTELKAQLLDFTTENESLRQKCTQSRMEIDSLRESFEAVKTQLNNVYKQLADCKAPTAVKDETKSLETSHASTSDGETSLDGQQNGTAKALMTENGCQTVGASGHDQSMQTSFVEAHNEEQSLKTSDLNDGKYASSQIEQRSLILKYTQLESECQQKEALLTRLKEELGNLRDSSDCLQRESKEDREKINKYITTIKSFEHDLALAVSEKEAAGRTLAETNELVKKLEIQVAECRDEHPSKISDLEQKLALAKIQEETTLESIKQFTDKIVEMENKFALQTKELETQICESTRSVELSAKEKKDLERRLEENLSKIGILEKEIQSANQKELEKDDEIHKLQKAVKDDLASRIQEKKMETEMKKTLKKLHESEEACARLHEDNQKLKSRSIKASEEAKAQEETIRKLTSENEELKASIVEKEHEMESFSKNRDEMIAKYENLVKSQQEEVERGKREITRLQELLHRIPTTPRDKEAKTAEETSKVPIPVVDLSDSETKRTTKQKALAPPTSCPSSDVKRSTRKKRLYQPNDDSCIDLETCQPIPPSPTPPPSTRSLRTRKK